MDKLEIGNIVRHKKDKYVGIVKSIDDIFVHLEDGRHILKCYAINIERMIKMAETQEVMTLEQKIDSINNYNEVTLKDTIDLMNSEDYKARFIAEYMQLIIRLNGLKRMLIKYEAGTLEFTPNCPIYVLTNQKIAMEEYLKYLEVRAEIEKIKLPKI